MNRINPIRSSLNHLRIKTTKVFYQHCEQKIIDVFDSCMGIEMLRHNEKEINFQIQDSFWKQIQEFYDIRKDPNVNFSFDKYKTYFDLKIRNEIKNEFGEVIIVEKDKIDNSKNVNQSYQYLNSSMYQNRMESKKWFEEQKQIPIKMEEEKEKKKKSNIRKRGGINQLFFEEENQYMTSFFLKYSPKFIENEQLKKKKIEMDLEKEKKERKDFEEERFIFDLIKQENDLESFLFPERIETNEDISFEYQERNEEKDQIEFNLPRLLLGRYYIKNQKEKWFDQMKFILSPFVNTTIWLKMKAIENFSFQIKEKINEIYLLIDEHPKKYIKVLFGFPLHLLKELDLIKNQFKYSVLWSVLLRLWVAHEEMKKFDKKGQDASLDSTLFKMNSLRWQLFIDTHIDLVRYMIRTNSFSDSILLDMQENEDSIAFSVLKQYLPQDRNFSYGGNLPNLTNCIFLGNGHYDRRPKHKSINLPHAMVHLFSKASEHKCQIRSFDTIFCRYLEKYPILHSFYRELLKTSLLGNYEHVVKRPIFELRMRIYQDVYPERYNDDQFFLWLILNERLMFLITKEFYRYNVENDFFMDHFFQQKRKDWKNAKRVIGETMDTIRMILNFEAINVGSFEWKEIANELISWDANTILHSQKWDTCINYLSFKLKNPLFEEPSCLNSERIFRIIHENEKFLRKNSKECIFKLKKGSFLDVMIYYMDQYFESTLINKHSTIPDSSEKHISESHLEDIRMIAKKIVRKHNSGKIKDGQIPIEYLPIIGISRDAFDVLRKLQYIYDEKNIPDNAIPKYVDFFYQHFPNDYFIFHCLIRAIMEKRIFREHWIGPNLYLAQERAIRLKKSKLPWEHLKENDDIFYYCTSCKKFKSPISDPSFSNSLRKNSFALGHEKAAYNIKDNHLYCTKKNISLSVKNSMQSGIFYNQTSLENTTTAKILRNYKSKKKCCETILTPIHMLGKILHLDKKFYILCSICARPTIIDITKFGPHGNITCGSHGNGFFSMEKQLSQLSTIPNDSLSIRIKKRILKEQNKQSELELESESLSLFEKLSIQTELDKKKDQQLLGEVQRCYYCCCELVFFNPQIMSALPRNTARPIFVMEDRSPADFLKKMKPNSKQIEFPPTDNKFRIINAFLCDTCRNRTQNRFGNGNIITRTELFNEVTKTVVRNFHNQQRAISKAY